MNPDRIHTSSFDNLELLSLHRQKQAFPKHFHETFCISLIREGIEAIQLPEQMILSEAGQITISQPFEVHANPLVDKDVPLAFDTLYLSPDLVQYYTGAKGVVFAQRQIINAKTNLHFESLKASLSNKNIRYIEDNLRRFLTALQQEAKYTPAEGAHNTQSRWQSVLQLIDTQLEEKITLDQLAHFIGMDKFKFARAFRRRVGMSPMHYVLMRKVFAAKALITANTLLTPLAYQFEFADQAHFSKTFRRFIGMSPQAYQKQLL